MTEYFALCFTRMMAKCTKNTDKSWKKIFKINEFYHITNIYIRLFSDHKKVKMAHLLVSFSSLAENLLDIFSGIKIYANLITKFSKDF